MKRFFLIFFALVFCLSANAQVQVPTQQAHNKLSAKVDSLSVALENSKAEQREQIKRLEKLIENASGPVIHPKQIQAAGEGTLPYLGSGFKATGGQGGQVIVVKNAQELTQALNQGGPRVIKLLSSEIDFRPYEQIIVQEGNFTLVGQPGGTTIWGLQLNLKCDNVILDNLRLYVGDELEPGQDLIQPSGWSAVSERDNLRINGNQVLLKNCVLGLATDELAQTTGSNIAFYRVLFLEPLASPKHHKGAHPKGTIHFCYDPAGGNNLAFIECAWLNCQDRTPQLTAGTTTYMRNCYISRTKFGLAIVNDNIRKIKRGPDDSGGAKLIAENVVINYAEKNAIRIVGRPAESRSYLYFQNFIINGQFHAKPWETARDLQGEGRFGKHVWQMDWHQAKTYAQVPNVALEVDKNYAPHYMPVTEVEAYVLANAGTVNKDGSTNPDKLTTEAIKRAKDESAPGHYDTVRGRLTEKEKETLIGFGLDPETLYKTPLYE